MSNSQQSNTQTTAALIQRIDELEMKTAFQEQLLSELNDVVTGQSLRLTDMERQLSMLLERAQKVDDDSGRANGDPLSEPPPPHY